ncbi:MAG: hypothetical protein H6733_09810 [Alphaproteobacteria bacterium]|nr:hypothetical protein [Alphaproteobacteria bacterium]
MDTYRSDPFVTGWPANPFTPLRIAWRDPAQGRTTVALRADDQAIVPGTVTFDDATTASFVPVAPLALDAAHQLSIEDGPCGATTVYPFRTAAWGAPVSREALVGGVYRLDLDDIVSFAPRGIDDPLLTFLGPLDVVLVEVLAVDEGSGVVRMRAAFADADGQQDRCRPTVEAGPEVTLHHGAWMSATARPDAPSSDLPWLRQATVGIGVADGGAAWVDLAVEGTLSVDLYAWMFGDDRGFGTTDDICRALVILSQGLWACSACPGDLSDRTCIDVDLRLARAPRQEAAPSLVARTPADIAADPACPSGTTFTTVAPAPPVPQPPR